MSPATPQQIKEILKSPFVHALAGGIGGAIALTATYPLDIIKTRLQVQANSPTDATRYKGTADAIQKIFELEGILGLYKGLPVGLLHTLINQFVYFYFYESLKPVYHGSKPNQPLGTFWQLLLGVHAATLNSAVTIPISVVSTRIQTDIEGKDGVISTFAKIIKQDGVAGLWHGIQPALILSINPAITHLFYERLKAFLENRARAQNLKAHLSPLQTFVIGAISKTISTIVTYPYILAKVRLQSQTKDKKGEIRYTGATDVLVKVIKKDGFFGLFRGMTPQIVKGVLSQAILFMMKEEIMGLTVRIMLLVYTVQRKQAMNK